VEIIQVIVHTRSEFQDKCSETLHYFLVSTLLAIVWQNCVVTSHHYRHFCDRLWQVWHYPLL